MSIGLAAAIIGGSVVSGVLGSKASKDAASAQQAGVEKASDTQLQATREGIAFQREQLAQSRQDTAPWRQAGEGALAAMMGYSTASEAFGSRGGGYAGNALTQAAAPQAQAVPAMQAQPYTQPAAQADSPEVVKKLAQVERLRAEVAADPNKKGGTGKSAAKRLREAESELAALRAAAPVQAATATPASSSMSPSGVPWSRGPTEVGDTSSEDQGPSFEPYQSGRQYDGPNITIDPSKLLTMNNAVNLGINALTVPGASMALGRKIDGVSLQPNMTGAQAEAARIANANPGEDYGSGYQTQVSGQDGNYYTSRGGGYEPSAAQRADIARDSASGNNPTANYSRAGTAMPGNAITAAAQGGATAQPSDVGYSPGDATPRGEFYTADAFTPDAEFATARPFTPDAEFTTARAFNPGAEFNQEFRFDASRMADDPGYQFRLREGTNALTSAARARGVAASGGALKELTRYASDSASQEYGAAYGRAATDFGRRYSVAADQYNSEQADRAQRYGRTIDTYNAEQADRAQRYGRTLDTYNARQADRATRFSRLGSIAGVGSQANSQVVSQAGQAGANGAGMINAAGGNVANLQAQGGNATGNAILTAANAQNNAIQGGIGNYLTYSNVQAQNANNANMNQLLLSARGITGTA